MVIYKNRRNGSFGIAIKFIAAIKFIHTVFKALVKF